MNFRIMMDVVINKKVSSRYKWLIFSLIPLFIVAGTGWFATGYLGNHARQEILENNESTILLRASLLNAEFKKTEEAVAAIAGSPWIAPALIFCSEQDIANANSVLDRYNIFMGAAVSYLMDSNGITIASSNRNDSDSFVGEHYGFRPYFTQAIKGEPYRYFALGVTTLTRGFYASSPVRDSKGDIVGVVVIKQDVNDEKTGLSGYPYGFLIDPNGIIFSSGNKEMLFKSLWPVDEKIQKELLASRQFGEKPFEAVMSREVVDEMEVILNGNNYLVSRRVINPEGWSIVIMAPTEKILIYRSFGVITTVLICIILMMLLIVNYKTTRSAEMVRESEIRFHKLFDIMSSGVVICQAKDNGENFIITDINPAGERIGQVNKQDIVGKTITEVLHITKGTGLFDVMQDTWKTGKYKYYPAYRHKGDRISIWVDGSIYKLTSGEIVMVYNNITSRKRREAKVLALTTTDPLTNLYNRRGFLTLTEQQLKLSDRTKGGVILFFIDINRMKWINDTLGHGEGDKALIEMAAILKETFRSPDIIARIGGDEFVVLAINTTRINPEILTNRLHNRIDVRNKQKDRKYRISISIGYSIYDHKAPCTVDELIAHADELMYEQKKNMKIGSA